MYLVTGAHSYTALDCLAALGASPFGGVVSYETMTLEQAAAPLCIFSDIERLTPEITAKAATWREKFLAGGAVVLNDPRRTLRRYDLLRKLYELDLNSFQAYRTMTDEMAFPVFLRSEREHTGALSAVVKDRNALMAALFQTALSPQGRGQPIIAVEFCDVGVKGVYHKYSAFRVGDAIIPRHLFFGKNWCLKKPDIQTPEMLEFEQVYLDTNPHEQRLREIFDLAHVTYGRIDYSMVGDRMEVWEINTNPVSIRIDQLRDPVRGERHAEFVERYKAALAAL